MSGFSIGNAAFAGVAFIRSRPVALLSWTIVQFAIALGFYQLMTGSTVMRMCAAFAVIPAALLMMAVLIAATNRAVLRPEDHRLGYLRLGLDELRQLALLAMIVGISLAPFIVVELVVALALGATGQAELSTMINNRRIAATVTSASMIALFSLGVLMIRLSLAPAMTFGSGKIDLFGSWRLTKGRSLALCRTYLRSLTLAGFVCAAGVFVGIQTPIVLVRLLIGAGVCALIAPLVLAPGASIYGQLHNEIEDDVAEVFS